jgi:hypothetical protein
MNTVIVAERYLRAALQFVIGCEHCAEYSGITFEYLLDAITGCDPVTTQYVMCRPVHCPRCSREMTEKTLVTPA